MNALGQLPGALWQVAVGSPATPGRCAFWAQVESGHKHERLAVLTSGVQPSKQLRKSAVLLKMLA